MEEHSGRTRGCDQKLKCGNSIPVLGKYFSKSGEMMEQVTQVGCGICIPGDTQSSSGHSCDLTGTTLSRGLDEMTSRDCFAFNNALFCDSTIPYMSTH